MYEAFDLVEIKNVTGSIIAQGVTSKGKTREFGIQVLRDAATNKLSLVPYRHFTDPESVPVFEGSEPWTEAERRGDTD